MRVMYPVLLLSAFAPGCFEQPDPVVPAGALARNGGGGGWDYNTDRWNQLGERLSFGAVAPSTITPSSHVVWALAGGAPPCVGATPGVTATSLRGSHVDGDAVVGPDVLVTAAGSSAPLAVGASVALSVTVRTEAEPAVAARPGALVLTRVADFRRPAADGDVRTRHVWPQYEAVFHPAAACDEPVALGVAIVGPAARFPDGQAGYEVGTLPGVFELLSTYQGGQEASLVVKAAFNLDLLLAFPGDVALRDRPCGSSTPVGNNLAFLAAFAIGNTHLIDLPPGVEVDFGGGDFGGGDFGPEAVPATTTPTLVFATQPGQAIRLSALFLDGGVARALCHDPATAPTAGDAAPHADLSWPASDAVVELDAIVADGWSLAVGERAANPLGFRLASGTAPRRLQAFASASPLPQRAAAVTAIQSQASATRLGALAGAVPSWGALRAAAVGRTPALVAVETLPPEAGADAFDHEVVTALEQPTCGDGVCGWDSAAGAAETCVADCEGPALPPPPPPAKVMLAPPI